MPIISFFGVLVILKPYLIHIKTFQYLTKYLHRFLNMMVCMLQNTLKGGPYNFLMDLVGQLFFIDDSVKFHILRRFVSLIFK